MITRIAIISPWDFPEGMAPTTRIIAYSKALVHANCLVDNYSFVVKKRTGKENESHGSLCDGVTYCIPRYFHPIGHKLIIVAIWDYVLLILGIIRRLIKTNKKSKYDFVFISFDYARELLLFVPILKLFHIKLIYVIDEFPPEIRRLQPDIHFITKIVYKFVQPFFSGRIVMTQALADYYNRFSNKPTFLLSTVVDTSRFMGLKCLYDSPYLCYMGNMDLKKDNVDNIIIAFSKVSDLYPDLVLRLYGQPNQTDLDYLTSLVKSLAIENKVYFMGYADYLNVPQILAGAKVLLASQPKTLRAQGGFPTKMGEYMLTGVPVIMTDAGEISKYIINGETAFLVPQEAPDLYGAKIQYVLDNYENALLVAAKGKEYILNTFSVHSIGEAMTAFLSSL